MSLFKYTYGLLTIAVLFSCKKTESVTCDVEETTVRVSQIAYFGNQPLNLDSTYRNFENFPIKIEKVNFFMSDIEFSNSSDTLRLQKPFLYRNNLDEKVLSYNISTQNFGDFNTFKMNVGVKQPENGGDPTTYDQSNHFSAYQSGDMHWSWNLGYIFLKIEGKYDTIPGSDETPLSFAWHIGNDINLKTVEKNQSVSIVKDQLNTFTMNFDLKKVFLSGTDSVFVKTNPVIHSAPGQEDVSDKIINNFATSIQIQ